jgi:hypothetical protein
MKVGEVELANRVTLLRVPHSGYVFEWWHNREHMRIWRLAPVAGP